MTIPAPSQPLAIEVRSYSSSVGPMALFLHPMQMYIAVVILR
jgi:hypothetical protein